MIRETIKEAMQLKGVSAASLCRQMNINEGTMSNYLKGKYQMSAGKLETMMQILGIRLIIDKSNDKKK